MNHILPRLLVLPAFDGKYNRSFYTIARHFGGDPSVDIAFFGWSRNLRRSQHVLERGGQDLIGEYVLETRRHEMEELASGSSAEVECVIVMSTIHLYPLLIPVAGKSRLPATYMNKLQRFLL